MGEEDFWLGLCVNNMRVSVDLYYTAPKFMNTTIQVSLNLHWIGPKFMNTCIPLSFGQNESTPPLFMFSHHKVALIYLFTNTKKKKNNCSGSCGIAPLAGLFRSTNSFDRAFHISKAYLSFLRVFCYLGMKTHVSMFN